MDIDALLSHKDWVRALAVDLLGDTQRAEDVVQETWIAALQHLKSDSGDGPRVRAWLARVSRNFARMAVRGEARRKRREELVAPSERVPSASESLERIAMQREVAAAVMALESPDREIVALRYFEELQPGEIARQLGLTPSAVYSRLSRARATLRTRLDGYQGENQRSWAVVAAAWLAGSRHDWLAPVTTGGMLVKTTLKAIAVSALVLFVGFAALQFRAMFGDTQPVLGQDVTELVAPPESEQAEPQLAEEALADDERVLAVAEQGPRRRSSSPPRCRPSALCTCVSRA